MIIANDLKNDPSNKGWVLGWGVVRNNPWSLVGVFSSKQAAETKASEVGDGHEVKYGSHRLGSEDFMS